MPAQFHWSSPYSLSVYLLVACGIIAIVILARWFAISTYLRNWLLFLPRLLVLGGLFLILLNPVYRSETQLPPKPASVAFLVDCSRSMILDRPASRLQQAKEAIQTAQDLDQSEVRPQIEYYRFGEHFAAERSVHQLQPIDPTTDIQTALRQLPSRFSNDPPQALVVFSDGAAQQVSELQELAESYRQMKVPLHVYPLGDTSIIGDVAIEQLIVPRRVEPGAKVPVRVSLRQTGFEGNRILLQVRKASRHDGLPLASLPVTLEPSVKTCELILDSTPDNADLVAEVSVLKGEAVVENNRVPFRVVSKSRKLRVMYMEASLDSEYRWIRDALGEDPDIECECLIVNHQHATRPRLKRVKDPYRGYPTTREELFEYDVVVCSDISQGAFTQDQIRWTVDLVADRGGGFAMVGGHTSFGSGGWNSTEWDRLIPFDMSGHRDYLTTTFRVAIPETAASHPIWRLVDDPAANGRALSAMPSFYGTNLISRVKPGATLLGESDRSLSRVGVMPVFGCETYGRGRTFAMATDSTYAWGRDFERRWGVGDNRYFRRFWRNVVRWLSENSIAGSKRLHVETDKVVYHPGETVQITARAFDESMMATTAYTLRAAWQQTSLSSDESVLEPQATEKVYRGELKARFPADSVTGREEDMAVLRELQLKVIAEESKQQIACTPVNIQVLDNSEELLNPCPAPKHLETLAEISGGRVLRSSADLAGVIGDIQVTPGEVVVYETPLWDRPYIWFVFLLLLAWEWSLRRRSGFR